MNTSTSASKVRQKMQGLILGLLLAAATGTTALAQETIVHPNYREADLRQIIEAVSDVTGKNFIIDPRVNAKVTMISNSPMTPDAFYEAFLAILQVHAYIAVPSGDLIKIVPDANARQLPGNARAHRQRSGRNRDSGSAGTKHKRRTVGPYPATADSTVRPPGGVPRFKYADYFGPRRQRNAFASNHPQDRSIRR